MEREINLNENETITTTNISNKHLETLASKLLSSLIFRFHESEDINTKHKIFTTLMILKSQIFAFELEHSGKSIESSKYTPYRANQIELLEITKDKPGFLTPRKNYD